MVKSTIAKDGSLPTKGPIGEGVDPLTEGKTTYGEDVKGNSTRVVAEAEADSQPATDATE